MLKTEFATVTGCVCAAPLPKSWALFKQTHFRHTNAVRAALVSLQTTLKKLTVVDETAGLNARSNKSAKTSMFSGFTRVTATCVNAEELVEKTVGSSSRLKHEFAAMVTSNKGVNWFELAVT